MRIEAVGIGRVGAQQVMRQAVGHGHHAGAGRQLFEKLHHLRLEMQAMPEHEVGLASAAISLRVWR